MGKYRRFTQEYKDEAVKLVIESSRPIAEVARAVLYSGSRTFLLSRRSWS